MNPKCFDYFTDQLKQQACYSSILENGKICQKIIF